MRVQELITGVVAVVLLTACVMGSVLPSADPDTFYGEWLARLPETLRDAPEFQREMIDDGVVTPEEHDRAQAAYRACIEEAGVRVLAFSRYDNGLLREASFDLSAPGAEGLVSSCEAEWYSSVAEGFRVALTPNDSAANVAARTAACMIEAGIDVDPSPPDVGALAADVLNNPEGGAAMTSCYERVKFYPPDR